MKISKYANIINIQDDIYAVFNSLLMQIIFVNKDKLNQITNFTIDKKDKQLLIENGIYVKNEKILDEIYNNLKLAVKTQSKQLSIMYLNISTFCNLACKYCFIENNPISKNCAQKMSYDTAKVAVDKFIAEINRTGVEEPQIIIYGGEPLTNFELLKNIINYIRINKKDLAVTMITNGTMLRDDEIKFLKQNRVGIGISLDGPKFINDKNRVFRSDSGSVYDSAIQGVKLLNKYNCNYCVSATVTQDVLDNKDKILGWIKKENIKNIFWNLYHYSTYDDNWQHFYEEMSDFILQIYNQLNDINVDEERVKEQMKLFLEQRFKFHNCGAVGLNQITVQPNGDVCICQGDSKSTDTKVGNITQNEISEILDNIDNKQWLEMYTIDRKECRYCEAISICGGGCPLQAEALFGSRKALDKATCIYYKKSLKWLLTQYYLASLEVDREEVNL